MNEPTLATNPPHPAKRWWARATTAALLVLTVGVVAGCPGGGSDSNDVSGREPNKSAEAEFVFANRGEVTQLDPNQMSWMQDIRIGQAIFEGAYTLDPNTLDAILGTASNVEHNDEYTEWTITIRDDAQWSNGDPVTADDFIFAWRRNMREAGDYSYLVNEYITGAQAYADAYRDNPATADFSAVGIEKTGDKSLKVSLENPTPYFPDLLTFVVYWPMHEASMEPFKETDEKGHEKYNPEWTKPGNLVSNGAFFLERNDQKQGQTLRANEHYWDAENVKSTTIRSLSPIEHQLAFQRYENGMIDWLTDIPGQEAYDMREAGRTDLEVFPAYGTYFWAFNTDDTLPDGTANPLANITLRKALVAAIDKKEIVDTITKMDQMPTTVYVPKNEEYFKGYPHPAGIATDVEQAKKWLAEAGYANGEGLPRLKLLYNTGTGDHEQIAQNLARQWRDKLGVEFDLDPVEMAQFKERYSPTMNDDGTLQAGDFHITRGSWYGDYMDVSTFTDKYKPGSMNNEPAWENPQYADYLKQAKVETDPQKRLELLAQAEALLLDEAVILPIYHYTNTFIKAPYVSGIPQNARMMVMMKNVETPRSTGPGAGKGSAPAEAPAESAETADTSTGTPAETPAE